MTLGTVTAMAGTITLNEGREMIGVEVTNMADRPIQVGSHYHFIETNPFLKFDRAASYGESWLVARGSWLVARGSWLVARGSWPVARGAWLLARIQP